MAILLFGAALSGTPPVVVPTVVNWDVDVLTPQSTTVFGRPRLDTGPGVPMIQISSQSTEYVKVPIRVRELGVLVDPTGEDVDFAFTTATGEPDTGDWVAGSWETDDNGRYFALCLVGPAGDVDPGDGTWGLWVRVTHSPELIARRVGTAVIT